MVTPSVIVYLLWNQDFGSAGDVRILKEVVAGVAEISAGVVDPLSAVLPSSAALESDAQRSVHHRRVDLVTDRVASHLVEHVRQRVTVYRQARDALVDVILAN